MAAAAEVDHRRVLPQLRAVQAGRGRGHRRSASWLCVGHLSGPWQVTKGYGSSWIFEPQLTCANALQGVHYPAFSLVDAKRFTGLLSTAEIAIGAALVVPVVPAWLAGAGLTAFALGTLGLYLRTPGMREEGSLRPTQQGIPLAKDAWMVGIGLALMIDEVAGRASQS
jgi:hypothetical protein